MPLFDFDADVVQSMVNFEDIINHYNLKGKIQHNKFVGRCPFHDDEKPSFGMCLKTGQWGCFGCHEKGSIYHFIQNMEDVNFVKALEWLARFVGITNNYIPSLEYSEKLSKSLMKGFNAIEEEDEFEHVDLPPYCETALNHFEVASKRVTKRDIKKYNIQYCIKGKSFIGCLIIPIAFQGKQVAFFSRDMLGLTDKTKRYNLGAKIGKIFFNWDEAIKHPSYVIVVEGIFDCLAVQRFGYNAVALLGSHLSITKEVLLLKNFKKIIIVLDNDSKKKYDANGNEIIVNPGQMAAHKLVDRLKNDIDVFNAILPEGKDPDECTLEEFELSLRDAKKWS
jgi:DNA primase